MSLLIASAFCFHYIALLVLSLLRLRHVVFLYVLRNVMPYVQLLSYHTTSKRILIPDSTLQLPQLEILYFVTFVCLFFISFTCM